MSIYKKYESADDTKKVALMFLSVFMANMLCAALVLLSVRYYLRESVRSGMQDLNQSLKQDGGR